MVVALNNKFRDLGSRLGRKSGSSSIPPSSDAGVKGRRFKSVTPTVTSQFRASIRRIRWRPLICFGGQFVAPNWPILLDVVVVVHPGCGSAALHAKPSRTTLKPLSARNWASLSPKPPAAGKYGDFL